MGFSRRVFNPSGDRAESDPLFFMYVYNDTSGSLSIGMPVYVDVRDAGEWNAKLAATAISPAIVRTGGKVVLGTTAAGVGTNATCVGLYAPEAPSDKPNNGDPIRVCQFGLAICSAQSPAGGVAGLVGNLLRTSTTVVQAVPVAAPVAGVTIGLIVATATFVANGNSIFAAASATVTLINAFVKAA